MINQNNKVISEVYEVLSELEEEDLQKIPKKILKYFKDNATYDVCEYINPDIPLDKLNLEEETKEILAVISYNYFCNDDEKKVLSKEFDKNEIKYQEELRTKYSPDKLFNNDMNNLSTDINSKNAEKVDNELVEYKESFLRKIFLKLKSILKI
jgi:hypothetical protein